jgi:hypothetical protein
MNCFWTSVQETESSFALCETPDSGFIGTTFTPGMTMLAAWVSAYGKMITLPESADWIRVDQLSAAWASIAARSSPAHGTTEPTSTVTGFVSMFRCTINSGHGVHRSSSTHG